MYLNKFSICFFKVNITSKVNKKFNIFSVVVAFFLSLFYSWLSILMIWPLVFLYTINLFLRLVLFFSSENEDFLYCICRELFAV